MSFFDIALESEVSTNLILLADFTMYTHVVLVICTLTVASAFSPRSDYSGHSIHPYTRTTWGDWGITEWCPHGTFAEKFALRIEPDQGQTGDDTDVNEVALLCR